jgi:hypothetical protein
MNITIESANDAKALRAASSVREEVFGKHCYRRLPQIERYDPAHILTMIARLGYTNEPIAALSVVETTGDAALHSALKLPFPDGIRVARYTQLAVLKAYRGLRLPAHMISEARRRFVLPNHILYTWLLCEASTARSSSFCRELGFKCSDRTFATEYGSSRVLLRIETDDAAESNGRHIRDSAAPSHLIGGGTGGNPPHPYIFPQLLLENEWLAQ